MIGGGLVTLVGLAPALIAGGLIYLITTALPGLQKEWADMDRERGAARAQAKPAALASDESAAHRGADGP